MIVYHILLLALNLSFADANTEKDIKDADYIMDFSESTLTISKDGTYLLNDVVSYKAQNEKGRTELGIRDVPFSADTMDVTVSEAYSLNGTEKTLTDLKQVITRSESPGSTGVRDDRKIVIPFSNVRVGTSVVYKTTTKLKTPLIPGVASIGFSFGARFPEMNEKLHVISERPIHSLILDSEHYLQTNGGMDGKKYRLNITLQRPIFKLPQLRKLNLVSTDSIPSVFISTADSWKEITDILAPKYDVVINGALPARFQQIADQAKLQKTDIEKINAVTTGVSRMVAYSGLWTNQRNKYFPRGHTAVVAEAKGDCKDFATSVAGILRKMGYEANVALVLSGQPASRYLKDLDPSKIIAGTDYFNHAITQVKLAPNRVLWIDATSPVEYADGISPSISGSPALVLKSGVSALEKIPENDPQMGVANIERTATMVSNDKAEWRGSYKSTGADAIQIMEQYRYLGKSKMETILPGYLLRNAASEGSKMTLNEQAFTSQKAQLEFSFDIVGKNPVFDTKEKEVALDLGADLSMVRFLVAGKETGAYFGSPSKTQIKTVFLKVIADDPVEGDCLVLSPWLDYERTIESVGNNTVAIETVSVKRKLITAQEAKEEPYEMFASNLQSCLRNSSISVHRADSPVGRPTKGEAPKRIHTIPIAKESLAEMDELFRDADAKDWAYTNMKAKRIAEKQLEVNPKDASAHALRAFAISKLGYISDDRYIQDYLDAAIAELDLAVSVSPNDYIVRLRRSAVLSALRKYDLCLADLGVAYRLEPKSFRVFTNLGSVYTKRKEFSVAEQWLANAKPLAKSKLDFKIYWMTVSDLADRAGDKKKAVAAHEQIVALEPESPWAVHNLSIAYIDIDEIDKAIEAERKALSIMDFGAARKRMGYLLSRKAEKLLGNRPPAQAAKDQKVEDLLVESNKYDPSRPEVYLKLAAIYMARVATEHETDWLDKSDIYLEEGLKRFPNEKYFTELQKQSQSMKAMILKDFRSRGASLSGRWPAAFAGGK